jgi:hypothetical protein
MAHRINKKLIAPCGMNCGVCKAYLRENNPCYGCRDADQNKPKTRVDCTLRLCTKREGYFCYACVEFPCDRLKRMDKRYRTKYGMSEIDNLGYIRDHGLRRFVETERKKWTSNKGIYCVHDKKYYK